MYSSKDSKKMLKEKYKWKDYYDKHCESIFTWWFQSFYLFEKFGIDKRKAHFASLINSGQLDRKTAMDLLSDNPEYPDLGLESRVMKYPKRDYQEFKTDEWLWNFMSKVIKILRKIK